MSVSIILSSVVKILNNRLNSKKVLKIQSYFSEVLENLKSGNTMFKNRFNNVCYISTYISDHGSVDIVYLQDSKEVSIFKESKCLYTQSEADKKIISEIIISIQEEHNFEINNVINFFGILLNKTKLEQSLGVKWEKFIETMNKVLEMSKKETIDDDDDVFVNEILDIDDILDKIGRFGINSLTIEERKFLDEYSRS